MLQPAFKDLWDDVIPEDCRQPWVVKHLWLLFLFINRIERGNIYSETLLIVKNVIDPMTRCHKGSRPSIPLLYSEACLLSWNSIVKKCTGIIYSLGVLNLFKKSKPPGTITCCICSLRIATNNFTFKSVANYFCKICADWGIVAFSNIQHQKSNKYYGNTEINDGNAKRRRFRDIIHLIFLSGSCWSRKKSHEKK